MNPYDYEAIVRSLDRYLEVPDDVLAEVVMRDGLCFWVFDRGAMPELTGQDTPDRELATRLCAGCPVMDQCLELELRCSGETTVGVWGALAENDRRAVYRLWRRRRQATDPDRGEGA